MKRLAVVVLAMGLAMMPALPAFAQTPSASIAPNSGVAGSSATVTVAGFTPGSTFEIHSGDFGGPLLGAGTSNAEGAGSVGVTIPADASAGNLTIAVCETTFVSCTNTGHEFWVGATTTFSVSLPPPPTTTPTVATTVATTVPATSPTPSVTPPGACTIPTGAIHLDFDEFATAGSVLPAEVGVVADALNAAGFVTSQREFVTVAVDGTRSYGGSTRPGSAEGDVDVSANAARDRTTATWLGSSSAPNVLRAVGPGHFSVEALRVLPGEMDYFGFNIGLGHYSEGFERPEYVTYEVSIRLLPVHETDGSITEASWDPVSVTLGPGPQAVNTCIYLENTAGVGHPLGSTWLIDVVPRYPDGTPIERAAGRGGIILEMDDMFYGSNAASDACVVPAGAIHLNFDGLAVGSAETAAATARFAADGFLIGQFDHTEIAPDGTRADSGPLVAGSAEGVAGIYDSAAFSRAADAFLGTSSPPNILRGVGPSHYSVESYRVLPAEMSYLGFNVGFSQYDGEGFSPYDTVVFDVSVRMLPVHESDGSVTTESWGTQSITVGPRAIPVSTCVFLENPGVGDARGSTWLVDIVPRLTDGTPVTRTSGRGGLIVEIDDMFYGAGDVVITSPVEITGDTLVVEGSDTDGGIDLSPLMLVLIGLGGAAVGGLLVLIGRRR